MSSSRPTWYVNPSAHLIRTDLTSIRSLLAYMSYVSSRTKRQWSQDAATHSKQTSYRNHRVEKSVLLKLVLFHHLDNLGTRRAAVNTTPTRYLTVDALHFYQQCLCKLGIQSKQKPLVCTPSTIFPLIRWSAPVRFLSVPLSPLVQCR